MAVKQFSVPKSSVQYIIVKYHETETVATLSGKVGSLNSLKDFSGREGQLSPFGDVSSWG